MFTLYFIKTFIIFHNYKTQNTKHKTQNTKNTKIELLFEFYNKIHY